MFSSKDHLENIVFNTNTMEYKIGAFDDDRKDKIFVRA